jgi:hypothetical protein
MRFDQLSQQLREVRSQMPRVSSEEAYAQMDRLLEAQKSYYSQRLPDAFVGFSSTAFGGQSGAIYTAVETAFGEAFESDLPRGSCASEAVEGESDDEGTSFPTGDSTWHAQILGTA